MTRTTPKTYRVWVVDKIIKKLYKDFEAKSAKEAAKLAEEDCWNPETGWKESREHEVIIDNYIDHVEPR